MKEDGKILTVKCPRCGVLTRWEGNTHRPFCSPRCRNVDLGAWVDEEYRVPDDSCPEDDESDLSKKYQKTSKWS
ncbi:MAG: uncharacterized protein PWP34_2354 [Desulfuromonadales bacterium]|jgi:hypothetical protein|nr:uncharacterized protein [Desulfuromonadales bacterium]